MNLPDLWTPDDLGGICMAAGAALAALVALNHLLFGRGQCDITLKEDSKGQNHAA